MEFGEKLIEILNSKLTEKEIITVNSISMKFLNHSVAGNGIKGDLIVDNSKKGLYIIDFKKGVNLSLFSHNLFKIVMRYGNKESQPLNVVILEENDTDSIIRLLKNNLLIE